MTLGYKNAWNNSQIIMANEAFIRFKPRILEYEHWIWY